ncbi:ABC transporter substrate-binding protein [Isobaculum melis]|uniref:ABC-type nitrate/sulfonate/bicarbonate transport system, substrate-binding protein n=1 Tax=Isobaculum melis TaxID=142588 RepID=A0A1H9UB56_9LACT|nr:ABC transporter substrate-binding protein [Isobaculum melis]SES06695.1 ABC-type nitrate/sulfonate/bicarbonate transport system, substrate-binding protein [Isobaculum melis]
MKKIGLIFTSLFLMISVAACGQKEESKKTNQQLKKITVVLDYVPNTNHTGMYVALKKGYYEAEGLDVTFIEPGNENTSATLVATGKGQFGVSYQEDVTYALTSEDQLPIKAIATIMEHNTSGFVSTKDAAIKTPKDFEGKVYAGWQSPSEEAVIKAVMKNANADFDKLTLVGDAGGGFAALGKDVDIKWFFEGWDNVKAEMADVQLNYLPLRELDSRLDYYTPVIIANQEVLDNDPETAKVFLKATKKGYQEAIAEPAASAEILHEYASDYELELLKKSQDFVSKNYTADPATWGEMKDSTWNNYTDFLYENGLIQKKIPADEQYTNQFLSE